MPSRPPLIALQIVSSLALYVLVMLFSLFAAALAGASYLLSIGQPVPRSWTGIDSVFNALPGVQIVLFLVVLLFACVVGIYAGTYVLRKTLIPPFLRWYRQVDPVTAFHASIAWGVNQTSTIPDSVIDDAERELLGFNPLKHRDVVGKSGLEKGRALRRLRDETMQGEWWRLFMLCAIIVLLVFFVLIFNNG